MAFQVTNQFLTSLQDKMRIAADGAFGEKSKKLTYQNFTSVMTDEAATVHLIIPISAEKIDTGVDETFVRFDRLAETAFDFDYEHQSRGLQFKRSEITDNPAYWARRANTWARDIGDYAARLPQVAAYNLIKANSTTQYDGLALFHASHRLHPKDASVGTFKNLYSGGSALPIGGTNLQTAADNLANGIAAMQSVLSADGETPCELEVGTMIVPPQLFGRGRQLLGASFLNSNDGNPAAGLGINLVVAPELASNPTTWYLASTTAAQGDVGAIVFWDREPFAVKYYDDMTDTEVRAMKVFSWEGYGRGKVFAGDPRKIFRFDAS